MIRILLFCINLFLYATCFAQGKLIFAIDIVRHGDRTPILASAEIEKKLSYGKGQLTPTGMRQEYDLGTLLRQRYVHDYHLLPPHYDANTMIVRSSSMPRTLMSAQSLLLGLYPPGTGPLLEGNMPALPNGFQPIPIYTVPLEEDKLLVPDHNQKKFQQLLKTYILDSPQWIHEEEKLQSNYPIWSKLFGTPIHNLFDLIFISDRLFIENLYNISLPDGLQNQEADLIHERAKWAWLYMSKHPELAKAAGNELAETIKREITLAAKKERPLKYLLYVAHDTTILAQLSLLGQALHELPPYAANLNYALFDMGSGHYEVRITYNQKPLMIERCGGRYCDLNEFIK